MSQPNETEVKDPEVEVPENLNEAQKLWKALKLPYVSSTFKTPKNKKFNHNSPRNRKELIAKKRLHALRVGRPK